MPSATVTIPLDDGSLKRHALGEPAHFERPTTPLTSRRAFAAAHVVADPLAENTPDSGANIDWEATLAFRRHLWSWGLPVAEAMDTAQRGMGLDWSATRELITRSVTEAQDAGGEIACGVNTDQLPAGPAPMGQIVDAYHEQIDLVEGLGGQAVVMASRHLAAVAEGPDDYHQAYGDVLGHVSGKVIVHWLGDMFDPALSGYWGSTDLDTASDDFIGVITENHDKVDGVKLSLLDREREIELRRRLPDGVRMYTGDDFDYPTTIRGDGEYHSDAFLGAFDLIAPAASASIQALDSGEVDQFDKILAPTLPLSRHVFSHPTYYYKTGVVFMAYLCGHQDHFRMVNGLEAARSVVHLSRQLVLADEAGLLPDPELAAHRMGLVLQLAGVDQT
ncbi:MAG: dihydrodipicolinate synthase family protein [Acidimicrobiia bacterium]